MVEKVDDNEEDVKVEESDDLGQMMKELGTRAYLVRSYARWVLDAGTSMTAWRMKVKRVPGKEMWYKPYSLGGKYWGSPTDHDPLFRAAIAEYWRVLQHTRTMQHLRMAALAERRMAAAVPDAAASLIALSKKGRNEQTKYNASRFLVQMRPRVVDVEDTTLWDESESDANESDSDDAA